MRFTHLPLLLLLPVLLPLSGCAELGMIGNYIFKKEEPMVINEAHRRPCGQPNASGYVLDNGCGGPAPAASPAVTMPQAAIRPVAQPQGLVSQAAAPQAVAVPTGYRPIAATYLPSSGIAQSYVQPVRQAPAAVRTTPQEFIK